MSDDPLHRALDACTDVDADALDWEEAAAAAGTSRVQHAVEALQLVTRIAEAHRTIQQTSPSEPPFDWGPLHVEARIGSGADGEVFRAFDPELHRDVALKLLFDDPGDRSGGVPEGARLARIRHPHVVAVFGAARHNGRTGIWMELVGGRSLAEEVAAEGPFDADRSVAAIEQVCSGLSAVHGAGLVHGDLKANNVVRGAKGDLVLMDLGCARETTTQGAHLRGTPVYLAPELLDGAAPGVRSDLYAAAVLLHFLLAAEYPVAGQSLDDVRAAMRSTGWPQLDPRVPAPLRPVLRRALSSNPADRFPSASDFAAAARLASPDARRRRVRRRWRAIAAALVVCGIAAGIAVPVGRARARYQNAMRSYDAAMQLAAARKWVPAATAAQQAVTDDPRFGAAHMMLAWTLFNKRAPQDQVMAEADRAIQLISSASRRDQYWMQAVNYDIRGQRIRAIRAYEALLADPIWPDRDDARDQLIALLARAGLQSEAVPYVTRRADLRPTDVAATLDAVDLLAETGDFARAREYAQRAQRLSTQLPAPVVLLPAREAYFRGDAVLAAKYLDDAIAALGSRLTTSFNAADRVARFALTLGRPGVARRVVSSVRVAPPSVPLRQLLLAAIAYWSGDRDGFRAEAEVAQKSGAYGFGFEDYLCEAGWLDFARTHQATLENRSNTVHDADLGADAEVARAHIDLAAGHPEAAISTLEKSRLPHWLSFALQERHYVLASAYLAVDRANDANLVLQQAAPQSPEYLYQLGWLRNVMLRAEVDHRLQREDDEAIAVGILERSLAAADPDFPLVRRLRALKQLHR